MRSLLPTTLVVVLALARSCGASQGDRSPAFGRCIDSCVELCPAVGAPAWHPSAWSPWSCSANCAYKCTTSLTNLALLFPPVPPTPNGAQLDSLRITAADLERLTGPGGELEGLELGRMVQFYGKWPFKRYLGTQELLSVLFSLANLWAHAKGFRELGRAQCMTPDGTALARLYRLNALVGINTWVWSTVFHTRDLGWTEKADYFSAAASTLYGLWLAIARAGGLYRDTSRSRLVRRGTQVVFGTVFAAHCAYLSRGRFDYGYNMTFNVTAGLAQILLWTLWALSNFYRPTPTPVLRSHPVPIRPRHYLGALQPVWLLFAFTALELLDFAPVPSKWRLLDAHALWHASTVGVVRLWYGFLRDDVRWVDEARDRVGLDDGGEKRRV